MLNVAMTTLDFKNMIFHQCATRPKNLVDVNFSDKTDLEKTINELPNSAKDPYSASLLLMASAALGDIAGYTNALSNMLNALDDLDKTSENTSEWMQNNSFKAWMWGRIVLAADCVNDTLTVMKAQEKLRELLEGDAEDNDNCAFFTWAWGYRAAIDQREYALSKERMIRDTVMLTEKYKVSGDHGMQSDAMWAWVMSLQAAAYAGDKNIYNWIKEQIKSITLENSVVRSLEKSLLRTPQSNDYPAWAMAKIRYAAIVINDKELYQEIETSLLLSIDGAQKSNANAEYVLSMLDNQLAILAAR